MPIVNKKSPAFSPGSRGVRVRGTPAGRVVATRRSSPGGVAVVTLDDGVTVTTAVEGATYPYTSGDPLIIATSGGDPSIAISYGFFFIIGSMPLDVSAEIFPSSDIYTVTTPATTFYLDVTVTPPTGLVFNGGGFFGPQVITGGESVTFTAFGAGPTPSLTTTLVDTSWTLKDQFDVVQATGTLPINNLRTVWTDNLLFGGTPYTMVASGITFTITRTGG